MFSWSWGALQRCHGICSTAGSQGSPFCRVSKASLTWPVGALPTKLAVHESLYTASIGNSYSPSHTLRRIQALSELRVRSGPASSHCVKDTVSQGQIARRQVLHIGSKVKVDDMNSSHSCCPQHRYLFAMNIPAWTRAGITMRALCQMHMVLCRAVNWWV